MSDITVNALRISIERLSKQHDFLLENLFVGQDDYSKPEVEVNGLRRRNEVLTACRFGNPFNKGVRIQYHVFDGLREKLVVFIDGAEEDERKLLEKRLSKVCIDVQYGSYLLNPSMDAIEKFVSVYFQAKKQVNKYLQDKSDLANQSKSLLQRYLSE